MTLDALVGDWEFAASAEGRVLGRGRTSFAWGEGRAFLHQRVVATVSDDATPEWMANAPFPVDAIIGLDDGEGHYSMLYADARGVRRVYRMTLDEGVWSVWRAAPGFHQRFTATFADEGATINGAWETSTDDGASWTPDFEMTYTAAAARLVTGVDFAHRATRDLEAAVAFYGEVLGLECSVRYTRAPGAEFETGNLTLCVMEYEAIGMPFSVSRHPIALQVADVAAARAALESRGVSFRGETIDSGVCRMAVFEDPDGNALMIHHRYAPRERVFSLHADELE